MPLHSMTVTAVTMEERGGLFTSSSTGNREKRQKRKMHIKSGLTSSTKLERICKYSHFKSRAKILPQTK
jgi:hypothetical protein